MTENSTDEEDSTGHRRQQGHRLRDRRRAWPGSGSASASAPATPVAATRPWRKLRADGLDVFGVPLDVTDDASVAAAAAQLEEQGGLDVLVNNAAITGGMPQEPTKVSADQVLEVVDTNVIGVIRVTNAMLPLLRRAASPRIVNVSSTVGSLTLQTAQAEAVGPISAAYSPTKSYLNAVTIQYAKELAGTGILVNAGCPGLRRDRPQRPPGDPYARAGRRDLPRARDAARRRAERHLPRRHGHPALVIAQ